MAKVKITADTILTILQQLMNDEDVNYKITDMSAPEDWQGKTIQEVLNVEYYTFRHRPMNTEIVVQDLLSSKQDTSELYALTRAFCLLSLGSIERVFSKEIDTVTASASLEYWIQTDKVKLLENLIDDLSIATSGVRIPVTIGTEERKAIIVFGGLSVEEIEEATEFGEMAVCSLNVELILYPNVYSRSDYTVEFLVQDENDSNWVTLPISSFAFQTGMTQKAVPKLDKVQNTGNINLSRATTFTISFEGYDNDFVNNLVDKIFNATAETNLEDEEDNNEAISTRITRGNSQYTHNFVLKEHIVSVSDTGNETHSLVLTTRGIK